MSFIVEIQIPADDFVFAQTMVEYPNVCIELERHIPISLGNTMPYLWVGGDSLDSRSFQTAAESDSSVTDCRLIDDLSDGSLFKVRWRDTQNTLPHNTTSGDEVLVQAVGKGTDWFLKIRFEERDSLSTFQSYCDERNISLDLLRLYESQVPKLGRYDISAAQRNAIVVALKLGYFDVPRNCTLSDVATELGLSVNAVSERIRRGEASLFRSTLTIPSPPPLQTEY